MDRVGQSRRAVRRRRRRTRCTWRCSRGISSTTRRTRARSTTSVRRVPATNSARDRNRLRRRRTNRSLLPRRALQAGVRAARDPVQPRGHGAAQLLRALPAPARAHRGERQRGGALVGGGHAGPALPLRHGQEGAHWLWTLLCSCAAGLSPEKRLATACSVDRNVAIFDLCPRLCAPTVNLADTAALLCLFLCSCAAGLWTKKILANACSVDRNGFECPPAQNKSARQLINSLTHCLLYRTYPRPRSG